MLWKKYLEGLRSRSSPKGCLPQSPYQFKGDLVIRHDVWPKEGTPYTVHASQQDLEDLQDRTQAARTEARWTCRQALEHLEKANRKRFSAEQLDAFHRLGKLRDLHRFQCDIIFKVFHDIDLVFFDGMLKRNAFLSWYPYGSFRKVDMYGFTCLNRPFANRVAILLSVKNLCKEGTTGFYVLNVLLHEMCHAYLMVCCGEKDHYLTADFWKRDVDHGKAFKRCQQAVALRFKGDSIPVKKMWWEVSDNEPPRSEKFALL